MEVVIILFSIFILKKTCYKNIIAVFIHYIISGNSIIYSLSYLSLLNFIPINASNPTSANKESLVF